MWHSVVSLLPMKLIVSIHTPTQGVTLSHNSVVYIYDCFNPHTHAGCDIIALSLHIALVSFNPHTHAGCDAFAHVIHTRIFRFQSTHPRRVWQNLDVDYVISPMFQSTHPRRVWHWKQCVRNLVRCFNPHTHAGCDNGFTAFFMFKNVSIHTPTQGVTISFK